MVLRLDVVVGGQYGSEGKGAFAAALAKKKKYSTLIRVAGPNAGHTVIHEGDPIALRQLPAAGLIDTNSYLYIGPGSEIDPVVLLEEIKLFEIRGVPIRGRLVVSDQAVVIDDSHRRIEAEASHSINGSTAKGIGAARAGRLMRTATILRDHPFATVLKEKGCNVTNSFVMSGNVMIEGTQGYWLGQNAGMYPYCTSSNCRSIDFVAMSGITDWDELTTFVLFRTFPIRIAGNSGPLYNELTWEQVGRPTEFTTVTKKPRRVGDFDMGLVRDAMEGNKVGRGSNSYAVLTFADYWGSELFNVNDTRFLDDLSLCSRIENEFGSYYESVVYLQTGPDSGIWIES
jgi:adenylosuccinate synthase